MATFQYQAVTPAGRLMKGALEAGSQPEAAEMLEQMQQHAAASLSAAFGSHAQQLVAGNNYLGAVAAFVG